MNIAICIIAYNRVDSLKRILNSIDNSFFGKDEPDLVISVDRSDTDAVEIVADEFIWKYGKKNVIKHETNLGLRKHVLSCGNLLKQYDALIVLEDDIIVSKNFYQYSKECCEKYKNDERIAGISLYNFAINYQNELPFIPLNNGYDVYFMNCAQSWGQVWIKDKWFEFYNWYLSNNDEFVNDGSLPSSICEWPKSSWLKYHTKYCIEQNKYFVYPYISLSTNSAQPGTHCKEVSNIFQVPLSIRDNSNYYLPNLQDDSIKYDGFFESKNLFAFLNIDTNQLCVDFYGEKKNYDNKRFWLTRKILNYRIVKSYSLQLKPYELNIILGNMGNEVFLYDTHIVENNKNKLNSHLFISYLYNMNIRSLFMSLCKSSFIGNKIVRMIRLLRRK